jgi:allantoin racemase
MDRPRLLIINPNSDPDMTVQIQKTAEDYLQGRAALTVWSNPDAPRFIETYADIAAAGPGLLSLVNTAAGGYRAIILACHYDPGLAALKEVSSCPVIGIGEASLRIAVLLGHRFSLLTTDLHSIPLHQEIVNRYGLQHLCASIRAPQAGEKDLPEKQKYHRLAQESCTQDKAEVLVLGCAGLCGLDKYLQAEFDRPVLDGIVCALMLAEGMAGYGGLQADKPRKSI